MGRKREHSFFCNLVLRSADIAFYSRFTPSLAKSILELKAKKKPSPEGDGCG
jgi:hypothetical protein